MNTGIIANKQGIEEECAKRTITVSHLPYFYQIHLNMPCNQRCIMCVPDGKHRQEILSLDEFRLFFENIKPYAEQLTLIGGEPLLYPHIKETLTLLAGHPIVVTINTNITLLTGWILPYLLALHGLELRCSIDAATRRTYHKIRGTDLFDKVTANLRRFAELSRDKPHIKMILYYVVMRENLNEILPFIDFAKTLGPHRVEFHPVRQVSDWKVENNTGWRFNGREQSCEYFKDEYNAVIQQAADKCRAEGLRYDVQFL